MSERNPGLVEDPLAVGLTRPAMRWGVTYTAIIVNAVIVMELFLLTKNLLVLSIGLPIHGLCMLVCAREPRWFELASLWAQTRLPALAGTLRFWRASSYAPLRLDLPGINGKRRSAPAIAL